MTEEIISKIFTECRKFAANEIRATCLDADLLPDADWIFGIWEKSYQLDLPFLLIPDDFCGGGCTPIECAMILDLLAEECAGIASVYAHHFTACIPLLMADVEHHNRFFAKFTSKKALPKIAAVIFPSESDASSIRWVLKDGQIIINGISEITGSISLADGFMMFLAETGDSEMMQCVWFDRSAKGITTGEPLQLQGLKVNAFGPILFDDVKIPDDNIIARGQTAKKMLTATRSVFYGFIAALSVGAARRAFEKAINYAKERYQFGKQIIHHQEIQRMLGNMQMKLNAGTAAYRHAFKDQKNKLSFLAPGAALVKTFCTDTAMEIVMDAIQIHGGYGYMHEYGIEKIMRDVKILQLLGGTNPYLKVRHIADKI